MSKKFRILSGILVIFLHLVATTKLYSWPLGVDFEFERLKIKVEGTYWWYTQNISGTLILPKTDFFPEGAECKFELDNDYLPRRGTMRKMSTHETRTVTMSFKQLCINDNLQIYGTIVRKSGSEGLRLDSIVWNLKIWKLRGLHDPIKFAYVIYHRNPRINKSIIVTLE